MLWYLLGDSDSEESDDVNVDETALMDIGNSDIKEEDETFEVSILELK